MSFFDRLLSPGQYKNNGNVFNKKMRAELSGFSFKSYEYLKGDWKIITDYMVKIFEKDELLDINSVYAMTFGYTHEQDMVVLAATPNEMRVVIGKEVDSIIELESTVIVDIEGNEMNLECLGSGISFVNDHWLKEIIGGTFVTKETTATFRFFKYLCNKTFIDAELHVSGKVQDYTDIYIPGPCVFTDEIGTTHTFYRTPGGSVELIHKMIYPCDQVQGQIINATSGGLSGGKALAGGLLAGPTGALIGASMGKKESYLYQIDWRDFSGNSYSALVDVHDRQKLKELVRLNQV